MNALFGRSNETNTNTNTNSTTANTQQPLHGTGNTQQALHGNKDADLARREHAGPEEEDDIHRTQQHQGGISGLAHAAGDAVKNTVKHVKERDVVVEKPAVVNEIVHDKNVHVVQPVVNRQVEVEHVKHHHVEHAQHEGKRTVDEGFVAGTPAGYQAGTHGTTHERGILKKHGSSSSSSSSDDEKRGRVGTTHRKTGATTGAGLTGHHATGTTGTGITGHNATGTTGTGLTGHNTTGTTGTGLAGHSTTTTGATTTHGTTANAPHEKKSMGEKIKEVFTGHH